MADAPPTTAAVPALASAGAVPGAGRRVTVNVIGLLGARTAVAVGGLVSLPVVFAHLGPARFGVWSLVTGLVGVLALLDLGLGSATVRAVAATVHEGGSRRTRATLGVAAVWGLVLVLLAGPSLLAGWPGLVHLLNLAPFAAEARAALVWLLVGLLADGVALPWRGVLEGTQRYPTLAATTVAAAVVAAVLAIVIVRAGGGLAELAMSVAGISATRSVAVILAARRQVRAMAPRPGELRRGDVRVLANYGLRVQVTTASGAVNTELDRFVLSGFFGPAVAGGVDLGGRLVNLLRLPAAFALVALFPLAVSRAADGGTVWLDRFLLLGTKYLAAFAAIGGAVVTVCAEPVVRLWLGQPTPWVAATIVILAPSYALNLATGAIAIVTRVEGRPGRETGYALLSIGVNLALTWPLLRVLGPIGVPLATSIGIVVGTGHFVTSFYRGTDRALGPVIRATWPPLLAALVAGAAGGLAGPLLPDGGGRLDAGLDVAGRASVVVLVAVAVLAATRFLDAGEWAHVRALLRRGTRRAPAPDVLGPDGPAPDGPAPGATVTVSGGMG